jgi:cobalt-zinc-cadmium efflux system membrane fusion protein
MNTLHRKTNRIPALVCAGLLLAGCGSGEAPQENPGQPETETAERIVRLTAAELDEFEIRLATAAPGTLSVAVTLPGEVKVNQDRFAHIVPRIPGFVHSANKSVGDVVRAGEVLAVLDSRDLADTKSDYLAGLERLELAQATFQREESLFEKKISSEQEYLEARQGLAEARIALRSARQKLLALGFSEIYIEALPEQPEHALVHYELTAPISGAVIERHISQGEALSADADAFAIADLSTVWVDLNVFQQDLDLVREGQPVDLVTTGGQLRGQGTIHYVRPIVGEETRTAMARVVLGNEDGRWKPGLFVSGTITVDAVAVSLVVPRSALIALDEGTVVFVETDGGLVPQPVTLGRETQTHVEITAGLTPGARYVARGGFALKAELEKGEHGEGHAH